MSIPLRSRSAGQHAQVDPDAAEHNSDLDRARADELYERSRRRKVPWKAVLLALFLFTLGSLLLTLAAVFLRRSPVPDNAIPLLTLGLLTSIPGIFATRIALWAWCGYEDFSFDDLPGFD